MRRDAWILAIETLSWIELRGLSERLALTKAAKQLEIVDSKSMGLAHKLVSETLRRKNLIDFLLNMALTPLSLKSLKLGPQAFLRLFVYETKMVSSNLQKASNIASIGRSILGWRELQNIEETLGKILSIQLDSVLKKNKDEERTGFLTYNPSWFVKYCFRLFGRKKAVRYLESTMKIPPTYIRLNTLKTSERNICKKIKSDGVILKKVKQLQHTYRISSTKRPLTRTRSYQNGLFYIQDKASCLATEIANPHPDMTVLDICASPGAKTTHLAQLMKNKGKIYSIDYSKRRIRVWKQSTHQMGTKIAVPIAADASRFLPINLAADLVILDPPCTSTGTFGKTPSAKWRVTKRSIIRMAKLQWEMLSHCVAHVKEGGVLIYSTCSITVEENEMLIEKLLKWHPEFTSIETFPNIGLPGLRGQSKCQRLYPQLHDCNGFFIAKLLKETD